MDQEAFERCLAVLETTPDWIEEQARRVPADGWEARVHGGEGGWNRRQMLAHIVTIDRRHAQRIRLGAGLPDPSGAPDQAHLPDINAWNQEQVDARAGRSIEELLAEMRASRADLIALLRSLTPEQRDRIRIERANVASSPFADWLPHVHEHAVAHMREIVA